MARHALLTGLQAPLLELDVSRRLEQRVEEAHDDPAGTAARGTGAPAVTPRLATRAARRSRGRRRHGPITSQFHVHVTVRLLQPLRSIAAT